MPNNAAYLKQWYEANKLRILARYKQRYADNPEVFLTRTKESYRKHNAKRRAHQRNRWRNDPEFRTAQKARCADWNARNAEKVREAARIRQAAYVRTPKGRIDSRMSDAIRQDLRHKEGKRGRPWQKLLGYTADQLKVRLESLFTKGMTWSGVLDGRIHIDHVIPKAKFTYTSTDDIEFKRCWALENLQPKWAQANRVKHTTLEGPSQIPLGI